MTEGLTKQAVQLLRLLEAGVGEDALRLTPSHEQMATHLGLKSKSGVTRLLDQLESRGYIRRIARRARAIELLQPNLICPHCGYSAGSAECVAAARARAPCLPVGEGNHHPVRP